MCLRWFLYSLVGWWSAQLIEAANDFHFAMMNDIPRNEFYRDALKVCVHSCTSAMRDMR